MRLRLGLVALLLASALLAAGCGGQDKAGPGAATGPRTEALSYYPADTPFVLLAATDPDGSQIKQALALVRRFAPGGIFLDQLKGRLAGQVDFDREIKPLLGNPIALGAPGAAGFGGGNRDFLVAWMAKDAGKLRPLVDRLVRAGSASSAPDHLGAKVYTGPDGTTLAVRGALVVFGRTPEIVTAALDRRAGADHLQPAAVDAARGDLPQDALVTGYGNVTSLLARPSAAKALQVPWVAALRAYAFTVSADGQGVKVDFRLDTTKRSLSGVDVPLAPGPAAPGVAAGAPARVGIRDFAHLVTWAERTQALTGSASATRFAARKAEIRSTTGVDFDRDLVAQFTGEASVDVDGAKRLVRAEVRDPAAMANTLRRLTPRLGDLLTGPGAGATTRPAPGGFTLVVKDGRTLGAYGLVGRELVAGTGSPEELGSLAAQPKTSVPGARGAVAFTVDKDLIRRAIATRVNLTPLEAPLLLAPVGDIRGWLMGDPAGLRGQFSLDVG